MLNSMVLDVGTKWRVTEVYKHTSKSAKKKKNNQRNKKFKYYKCNSSYVHQDSGQIRHKITSKKAKPWSKRIIRNWNESSTK